MIINQELYFFLPVSTIKSNCKTAEIMVFFITNISRECFMTASIT